MSNFSQKQPLRLWARVSGRVQGVSYRYYTQRQAQDLGLVGWVMNQPDGSVELVAEGSQNQLSDLLTWCQQGPSLASVASIEKRYEDATGEFASFDIRY